MYAVVGCTDCGGYWLLTDPESQDSANCPTCGKSHRTEKLRRFYEAADRSAAVQARSKLLADKRDESEQFAELADAGTMERAIEDGETGVDEREYLERSGLDADEVAAAGDVSGGGSRSRDEIVREAVESADDRASIISYATDHGVPESAAEDLLDKLRRRGEVTEAGGSYRLL
ncbi:MAG: DUF5817 domain-containing protein [Halobaculum sp.]